MARRPVKDIMVNKPFTVSPDMPPEEALQLGQEMGYGAFPVMEEGRLIGYAADITEQKQIEEALRESEEKYKNLFQSSFDGIAESDLEGDLISCNEALRMTGHSEEELKTEVSRYNTRKMG